MSTQKQSGKKRNSMQIACEVVEPAIGEHMDGTPLEKTIDLRNPHAVLLGSIDGRKGGEARAKS
jgi:hypothetical protein